MCKYIYIILKGSTLPGALFLGMGDLKIEYNTWNKYRVYNVIYEYHLSINNFIDK